MMKKKRIQAEIDRLRDDLKIVEHRYNIIRSQEAYMDLQLYRGKIASWKRLLAVASDAPEYRPPQEPERPAGRHTLEDVLTNAVLPIDRE